MVNRVGQMMVGDKMQILLIPCGCKMMEIWWSMMGICKLHGRPIELLLG